MRLLKMMLIAIVIGGVSVLSLNCTAASDTAPQYQTAAVPRGNLTIDITGVGNLALSQKDDLAFEIAGTVAEVLVKEGDTVEKGQVLAKLDTSDWETQLSVLEDKVTAAERQLTAKKRAVTTAERQLATKKDAVTTAERQLATKKDAVTTAERQLTAKKRNVTAKERDVVQAEINLKDAQTALDTVQVTYTVADFLTAQAAVDAAKTELDKAILVLSMYETGTEGYNIKRDLVSSAQSRLKSAQAKLDDVLSGFDKEVTSRKQQVETAQWKLEDAQIAVEDAQIAVEDAQKGIENAQIAVADAQKAIENAQLAVEDAQLGIEDAQLAVKDAQKGLDDAQEALAEAKSDHPEIIAPSAGFITKVNVIGGDEVKKGTVAMTLADPNKFEADILVNETDILQTKLGGNASVQVEAMPGMSLPAKVTHIAPTAVIQQGVVNYKVKVAIESLQSVMQARQPAMGNLSADNITSPRQPTGGTRFSGNVTAGALPDRMRQAIEGSGFTQEQIEEMRRQRQQGRAGLPGQQPEQMPTMFPENFQLREGLTVTVTILVAERYDVLLVPNSAITRRGMESMVKVLKDGVVEERAITTGISNWQYTEVTGGLSEGEQVVIPQSTTTTTPTTSQRGGGMRIPGMGGFGR